MRDFRTPTARVRGLGSAHEGTGHWINQRASAIALVPLVVWFMFSLVGHLGAELSEIQQWIGNPLVAIMLTLALVASFYHARLGVQVVIEDYIQSTKLRALTLVAVQLALLGLAVASVFSVWKIALV